MNCQNCGAPMRLQEDKECLLCDYCGNIFYPDRNDDGVRVLSEASPWNCPVCAINLTQATLSGQPVAYCTRCRGFLVDMSVFVNVVQLLRSQRGGPSETVRAANPRDLERRIECPKCHCPMDTHFYAGPGNIVIDDCSPCEVNWLDYGEVGRIAAATDRAYDEVAIGF